MIMAAGDSDSRGVSEKIRANGQINGYKTHQNGVANGISNGQVSNKVFRV